MLFDRLKKLMVLLCLASILTLTGCSTMQGVGRDIGSVGNSLENAAERASR